MSHLHQYTCYNASKYVLLLFHPIACDWRHMNQFLCHYTNKMHAFVPQVEGKKIKYTVCVTTTNGKPRKNGKYGKVDKKFRGCNIDPFGLGAGNKPNKYFVYTRYVIKSKKVQHCDSSVPLVSFLTRKEL